MLDVEFEELLIRLAALDKLCLYDRYNEVITGIESNWQRIKPDKSDYYAALILAVDDGGQLLKAVSTVYYDSENKRWLVRSPSYSFTYGMVIRWDVIESEENEKVSLK
ncbi:MAG: hypothetical protein HFE63_01435 [Clostridiales bacterium]|nr:hypothetical protein [Clostridiales bacterium]